MTSEPIKFLLVDDKTENLFALEAIIRREGLEVLLARSGSDALELLLVHDVSLALLDVQMPVMDGFEFLDEIRRRTEWRDIPVLVLTAKDLTAEDRGRLNVDVERILQKRALDLDELLREIARILPGSIERGHNKQPQGGAK